MRHDASPPNLVDAHLIDQPRDGMERASGLEGADALLVLAFHPDAEAGHALLLCGGEGRRVVGQERRRVRRRRDPAE